MSTKHFLSCCDRVWIWWCKLLPFYSAALLSHNALDTLTWYYHHLHYTDTSTISPSSSSKCWAPRQVQLIPFSELVSVMSCLTIESTISRPKGRFVCLFDLGLTSLSTIFQSYRDGVWIWQGAQCSLLECCLTDISCPDTLTRYSTQSYYTDTELTSSSSIFLMLSAKQKSS